MDLTIQTQDYLDSKIGFFNKDPGITTIYVGNLSYDKTEAQIKSLFEVYGGVNYVKIIKDSSTHLSKGIAFVQMYNGKHAKLAISKLNESELDGRVLKVSVAEESNTENNSAKRKRRKPYKPYVAKKDRVAATTL